MDKNKEVITNKNYQTEPSVAIICLNAQRTLKKTLESVKDFKEIVIVDNGSIDRTFKIAKNYTEKIFTFKTKDFKLLREFALKMITSDWVFFIDADEIISKENKNKLLKIWSQFRNRYDGIWLKRRNYYGSKENQYLKYGLFYPDYQLRLFKKKYQYINNPHEIPNIPLKKTYYCRDVEIFHYPNKKKLFSFFGWLTLLPLVKIHAVHFKNKNSFFLFFKALFSFINLFFLSLTRGKGFLDGYYGILAAYNFSIHISLIYLYAIFLKFKKNH